MNPAPTLLLASNSPRRRQLISLGGWTFNTAASNIDESILPGEQPAIYVTRLAKAKARACLPLAQPGQVVIGSDTSVISDGDILGKPADADEAISMLRRLRGRTHQVYTAIATLEAATETAHAALCITDVPMRNYSETEIATYVATGDPLDKAGAYAIQHPDFQPVAAMAGCFASVMGLPLCHLTRLLRALGRPESQDVPAGCQAALQYQCPVYHSILNG